MFTIIKKCLIKTKIYTLYKKWTGRKQLEESSKLLIEEFQFSLNADPDSRDALYGKIRLRIHGFEKSLVKGNIPKEESVVTLFPLTERLIRNYPEYPISGDAVVETIGIAQSVILAKQRGVTVQN